MLVLLFTQVEHEISLISSQSKNGQNCLVIRKNKGKSRPYNVYWTLFALVTPKGFLSV